MIINAEVRLNKKDIEDKNALERALKKLKNTVIMEGVIDKVKSKRSFETPKQKKERKLRQRLSKIKLIESGFFNN